MLVELKQKGAHKLRSKDRVFISEDPKTKKKRKWCLRAPSNPATHSSSRPWMAFNISLRLAVSRFIQFFQTRLCFILLFWNDSNLMINSFSIGHTANFLRSFDIGLTSIMVEKFWEFGFGLQAWLLDQFGVVHDGKQPYPGAISTCMFYQLAFDVWERYFMSLFVTLFLSSEW